MSYCQKFFTVLLSLVLGCLIAGGGLCLLTESAEAGTLEVVFSDQNLRYTLFTLYNGEAEYVHVAKMSEMFRLEHEIDPIDGRVVLRYGAKTASFFPGQNSVIADRRTHFLDVPPLKIEGVVMVPVQFLTTILPLLSDQDIVWEAGHRRLVVGVQNLEIYDVLSSPYGDYTRIAVDMSQVVAYKIVEKLPSLLIFELPHSTFHLSQNPLQIDSRSVKHVKVIDSFGTTQIIIRLGSEFVRYTHQVTDDPPRLLIDVYNTHDTQMTPQTSAGIHEEDLIPSEEARGPEVPRNIVIRTVAIDPGHGGSDRGILLEDETETAAALFEKHLTLQIATLLESSLSQRLGCRVVATRKTDDFVSPEARTTLANSNRADIFVSLHVNNSLSPSVSGFEVYIMDYGSLELPTGYDVVSEQSQMLDYAQAKYVDQSEQLARQIITAYQARSPQRRAVMKRAPLFTLKGATMPAVHLELGYGSNEQDRQHLLQEDFQQLLVAAITDGIVAYRKSNTQ